MLELKPCKCCGGMPKLNRKNKKFFYECDGDCWTVTDKHRSWVDAIKQWNDMQMEEGEADA